MAVTIVGNNNIAGGVIYGDGTNYVASAAGTSGQVLVSAGSGAPTWSNTPTLRQTVSVIGTNTAAAAGTLYVLTASLTLTLPATPTVGSFVTVQNSSGTTTPVIARNGSNIMSLAEDMTINTTNVAVTLVYADATRGWVFG
jgi:hypothetical protein